MAYEDSSKRSQAVTQTYMIRYNPFTVSGTLRRVHTSVAAAGGGGRRRVSPLPPLPRPPLPPPLLPRLFVPLPALAPPLAAPTLITPYAAAAPRCTWRQTAPSTSARQALTHAAARRGASASRRQAHAHILCRSQCSCGGQTACAQHNPFGLGDARTHAWAKRSAPCGVAANRHSDKTA